MNRRNLQKELEMIISEIQREGRRPRLLLHVCCAPCSTYCLEYLSQYFDITVLFANSNIDDCNEYIKRRDEEIRLLAEMSHIAQFSEGKYDPDYYHKLVSGHEDDPECGERCEICYNMRLDEAARYAAVNGFDFFTTSLSISPLKDALRLCRIGEAAAEKYGTHYLPSDFKKKDGYKRSIVLSNEHRLYRQNYCGCSFSKKQTGGIV